MISEQSYYRWRSEYGGLKLEQGAADEGSQEGEWPSEEGGGEADAGQADPERGASGKLLNPERRRRCVRSRASYPNAATVAPRWFVYTLTATVPESRVGLRFRRPPTGPRRERAFRMLTKLDDYDEAEDDPVAGGGT